jgi:hypothetical protein
VFICERVSMYILVVCVCVRMRERVVCVALCVCVLCTVLYLLYAVWSPIVQPSVPTLNPLCNALLVCSHCSFQQTAHWRRERMKARHHAFAEKERKVLQAKKSKFKPRSRIQILSLLATVFFFFLLFACM